MKCLFIHRHDKVIKICIFFIQYLQAFKLICQGRTNENGENLLSIYHQKLNHLLGTKQPIGIQV